MRVTEPIIFERGEKGLRGYNLPAADSPKRSSDLMPQKFLRMVDAELPEVAEIDALPRAKIGGTAGRIRLSY